jgi:hypothetical protein
MRDEVLAQKETSSSTSMPGRRNITKIKIWGIRRFPDFLKDFEMG